MAENMLACDTNSYSKCDNIAAAALRPRPIIGKRELLFVLLACLLVAFAPSAAQYASANLGGQNGGYEHPEFSDIERPEANFPGSAFYFLEDDSSNFAAYGTDTLASGTDETSFNDTGLPANYPAGVDGAAMPIPEGTIGVGNPSNEKSYILPGVGPVARPFRLAAGSQDYGRALRCLTDAIYYEGATEPEVGQRAIAQVILNRVRHPSYPNSVCGVIYQGSERVTGCQFSYSCDGSMRRRPSPSFWQRGQRVAAAALAGSVYAPVGLATHYHTTEVNPYWAPSLRFIGTIGAHRFYTFKGNAGSSGAFNRRYAGGEPLPAPKPRAYTPAQSPTLDPMDVQRQYERDYAEAKAKAEADARLSGQSNNASEKARQSAANVPAPVGFNPQQPPQPLQHAAPTYSREAKANGGESTYKASRLPTGSGSIKSEFQNSGSWKTRPGD